MKSINEFPNLRRQGKEGAVCVFSTFHGRPTSWLLTPWLPQLISIWDNYQMK